MACWLLAVSRLYADGVSGSVPRSRQTWSLRRPLPGLKGISIIPGSGSELLEVHSSYCLSEFCRYERVWFGLFGASFGGVLRIVQQVECFRQHSGQRFHVRFGIIRWCEVVCLFSQFLDVVPDFACPHILLPSRVLPRPDYRKGEKKNAAAATAA